MIDTRTKEKVMFRQLMLTSAASLALGIVPQFATAQDQPTTGQAPAAQEEYTAPDRVVTPEATPDAAPAQGLSAAPAPTGTQMSFVMSQEPDQWLASDLIGESVIGGDGESIGEISDVVLGPDNQVEAFVLDVGGFLGIGAHTVAVSIESLQRADDGDGGQRLTIAAATTETLEAAPEFMTLAAQAAAARQRAREAAQSDESAAREQPPVPEQPQ
ncbi:PRC-barrel domain-containing protein [Breoghania sp. L-A4]|uniref:PRC-barrel domain-containing protein n=1 Tax=Breoghania sp. L-A4 TaxID=2304600 RepID=UPI0013C2A88C|nr:PRC-barrel domain-containing protein [Breoghania sp. L-A4]